MDWGFGRVGYPFGGRWPVSPKGELLGADMLENPIRHLGRSHPRLAGANSTARRVLSLLMVFNTGAPLLKGEPVPQHDLTYT